MVNLSVNVEIVLKPGSYSLRDSVVQLVKLFLENSNDIKGNTVISEFNQKLHSIIYDTVQSVIVDETPGFYETIDFSKASINFFTYSLDPHGPTIQFEENEEDGQLNIATHQILPSAELHNLWENLFYENNIKINLLKYAHTIMEFSKNNVDTNIISCNRVILLHGPPGTGKTSLCKALAHKLSIRMQSDYDSGVLIEINSHSLFSKWFSESGKLVTKMFLRIREIVENPKLLVCVLIDEVESLAHARNQCVSGNEPSDSVRVVNAVLTQIDQLKRHSNVLVFTTSNITESIDIAFIDRADIKQYLGLPSVHAIYQVYYSCLQELRKVRVLNDCEAMVDPLNVAMKKEYNIKEGNTSTTAKLLKLCEKSLGLSGRSLRKIPFIAHALFLNDKLLKWNISNHMEEFLDAMEKAIDREKTERCHFNGVKD